MSNYDTVQRFCCRRPLIRVVISPLRPTNNYIRGASHSASIGVFRAFDSVVCMYLLTAYRIKHRGSRFATGSWMMAIDTYFRVPNFFLGRVAVDSG